MERCLNSFDNVHEWADCIAFLKQLLKVNAMMQSYLWSNLFMIPPRRSNHICNSRRFLANSLSPNVCHNVWTLLCQQEYTNALLTYTRIFSECWEWATSFRRIIQRLIAVFQTEGLKRDLPLWSSGLFPFFEYAATSVKVRTVWALYPFSFLQFLQPMLLELYDTYYLPMQAGLRPIMKSFILALLPGLEEETSEFFDKVRVLFVSHACL